MLKKKLIQSTGVFCWYNGWMSLALEASLVTAMEKMFQQADEKKLMKDSQKLDAILVMLKEVMKAQVQELHELQQAQLSLLSELINFMPHLFVILPARKREKLDKSATWSSKIKNCMLRMKDSV